MLRLIFLLPLLLIQIGCSTWNGLGHPDAFYTGDAQIKEAQIQALSKPMFTMRGPWSCDDQSDGTPPPPRLLSADPEGVQETGGADHPCLIEIRNTAQVMGVKGVQRGKTTGDTIESVAKGLFNFGGKWVLLEKLSDMVESQTPTQVTINGDGNNYERGNEKWQINTSSTQQEAGGNLGDTYGDNGQNTGQIGDSRGDESHSSEEQTYGDNGNNRGELNTGDQSSTSSVETTTDNTNNSVTNPEPEI